MAPLARPRSGQVQPFGVAWVPMATSSSDASKEWPLRQVRKARYTAAFCLALAISSSWPGTPAAHATLVQALDLAELVQEAEHVVVARVIRQHSLFDAQGRIVTDVLMQVESVEKGSLTPGESVTVRRLGGEVDGLGMRIEGEPAFDDGERVLLFGAHARALSVLRPVGMSQGTMRVYEQDGEPWVMPDTSGLTLVRKQAQGTSVQRAVPETPRRLQEVLSEIRKLVAQSKQR